MGKISIRGSKQPGANQRLIRFLAKQISLEPSAQSIAAVRQFKNPEGHRFKSCSRCQSLAADEMPPKY